MQPSSIIHCIIIGSFLLLLIVAASGCTVLPPLPDTSEPQTFTSNTDGSW